MLEIARKLEWDSAPLHEAYDFCLANNLVNTFYAKKNKFKSSPNRQRKVGFFCLLHIDRFEVFTVIQDRKGIEISRVLLESFETHHVESFYYVDWKWLDNDTVELVDKYKYGTRRTWMIKV
jgi:hypothetical protein